MYVARDCNFAVLQFTTLDMLARTIHMAMECFTGVHNEESGLQYMFQLLNNARTRETRSSHTYQVKVDNIRTVTGHKAY